MNSADVIHAGYGFVNWVRHLARFRSSDAHWNQLQHLFDVGHAFAAYRELKFVNPAFVAHGVGEESGVSSAVGVGKPGESLSLDEY